ncbi:MAG: response regulator/sensor histidine kinase, partial [Phenylobacterium sp.]|nr:response regulator/sensor histidine kinase [Phenylobacterium sp.]
PHALLKAQHVEAMSMILHELATNAAKYGALSSPQGVVTVGWGETEPGQLTLTWREEGGPAAAAPSRNGFGSRLILRLARQLGGEARYDWRPQGLRLELTAAV